MIEDLAQRVIRWWTSAARDRVAFLLIVGVWFIVAVPPALFRGYHYVEGLTVTIAHSALQDGQWLTPHLYNSRWIERPTLLSWIIAALSFPFGHVYPFVARLPTILCLLAGCFLIWRTLRPKASAGAALMGAASFLAAPIVMRYYSTSVADIPLAVVLFGTFLVWWHSFCAGRITVIRWICIGCLLAIAGLLKGPQPVAYFLLGLGAFVLLTSTWWQIPGFALAGIVAAVPVAAWYAYVFVPGDQNEWIRYTRLATAKPEHADPLGNSVRFFFQAFPATVLASALLFAPPKAAGKPLPDKFILALCCYAFTCTAAILFWPAEVNARHILPMVLPLSVLAGLGYDSLLQRSTALVAAGICTVAGLLGYAAVHATIEQALRPEKFRRAEIAGAHITELVLRAPAPIYRTVWSDGLNELPYVPLEVTMIDLSAVSSVTKPAWIVVSKPDGDALIANSNGHIKSSLELERSVLLRME